MRNPDTASYWPAETTVDDFLEAIAKAVMDEDIFEYNMKKLFGGYATKFPEEWMELFTKWMELNK